MSREEGDEARLVNREKAAERLFDCVNQSFCSRGHGIGLSACKVAVHWLLSCHRVLRWFAELNKIEKTHKVQNKFRISRFFLFGAAAAGCKVSFFKIKFYFLKKNWFKFVKSSIELLNDIWLNFSDPLNLNWSKGAILWKKKVLDERGNDWASAVLNEIEREKIESISGLPLRR